MNCRRGGLLSPYEYPPNLLRSISLKHSDRFVSHHQGQLVISSISLKNDNSDPIPIPTLEWAVGRGAKVWGAQTNPRAL